MRIAVAVSGGVDSLCALLLLRRAGHEVFALHALLGQPAVCGAPGAPDGLEAACRTFDVPLEVVDLRAAFAREVITPFARAYAGGLTPNPCARCNRSIKFGALMDAALGLGAEALATGHYARLAPRSAQGASGPFLAMAAHTAKDQSYFLSLVPRERLARALFPLAGLTKTACRALVAGAGLEVPLPGESHDICFAPGGVDAYREFLARQWQDLGITPPGAGPVLLCEGAEPAADNADGQPCAMSSPQAPPHAGHLRRIGTHAGLWRYTEGQRRGLGLAYAEALHVLRKDIGTNALIVGPRSCLGMRGCIAGEVNVLVAPGAWPGHPLVRCRYGGAAVPARVRAEGEKLRIDFEEGCFTSAPGQVVTLYDEDGVVLAGGVVEEIFA